MGGQIAWHYALMYPSKVEKLVLIDAAGLRFTSSKPPLAFRLARIPILNQLLTKITPRSVVRKSIEDVYSDKSLITDNLIDRYLELALRKGNRQAMVVRLTTTIDYNKIPDLQKMYMPTLILWGNDDKLIPVSSASEFSTLIPNDTMVIIPNCGHVPMEECPVKSLQALRSFLRI